MRATGTMTTQSVHFNSFYEFKDIEEDMIRERGSTGEYRGGV